MTRGEARQVEKCEGVGESGGGAWGSLPAPNPLVRRCKQVRGEVLEVGRACGMGLTRGGGGQG